MMSPAWTMSQSCLFAEISFPLTLTGIIFSLVLLRSLILCSSQSCLCFVGPCVALPCPAPLTPRRSVLAQMWAQLGSSRLFHRNPQDFAPPSALSRDSHTSAAGAVPWGQFCPQSRFDLLGSSVYLLTAPSVPFPFVPLPASVCPGPSATREGLALLALPFSLDTGGARSSSSIQLPRPLGPLEIPAPV